MTVSRSRNAIPKVALLFSALAASVFAQPALAQQTLNIGYQKASGLLSIIKSRGLLEEAFADQDIDVNWREFAAGPQLLEALHAGSVDFGYTGAPPPIFAQAAGIDLRYVGATRSAPDNEAILVPADSTITSVEELSGKRVAVQRGSSANYLVVAALEQADLAFDDIRPAYLTPADARGALVNGNIDAWAVWEPYLSSAEQDLDARILADYSSLTPTYSFYEASAALVDDHPELVEQLLEALEEGAQWINDNQDEVISLLSQELGLPVETVATWQQKTDYSLIPIDDDVIANQQSVADTFYQLDLIPAQVDVATAFWTPSSAQ